MTLRNFGPANPRAGGSDVIHFDHGSTPYIVTRCTINGGSARGMFDGHQFAVQVDAGPR